MAQTCRLQVTGTGTRQALAHRIALTSSRGGAAPKSKPKVRRRRRISYKGDKCAGCLACLCKMLVPASDTTGYVFQLENNASAFSLFNTCSQRNVW
jgi:hypothetical protein